MPRQQKVRVHSHPLDRPISLFDFRGCIGRIQAAIAMLAQDVADRPNAKSDRHVTVTLTIRPDKEADSDGVLLLSKTRLSIAPMKVRPTAARIANGTICPLGEPDDTGVLDLFDRLPDDDPAPSEDRGRDGEDTDDDA